MNEKSGNNCDFETFKDIMSELADDFDNVSFSDPEDGGYFYLLFQLYHTHDISYDLPSMGIGNIIGHVDGPENIINVLNGGLIYSSIDDYINDLNDFKGNIDNIINLFSKIKEVFKIIEDYILPRFEHFDNFKACSVGFDEINGNFIITFDTDEFED
jgi:hypothetical protein